MLAALLSGCVILKPHAWPAQSGKIVLSFDDGPSPATTKELLAILRKHGVKATFCVIGYNAHQFPDEVEAIRGDGHLLANHTYNHHPACLLSGKTFARELRKTDEAIGEVTNDPDFVAKLVRPPYGVITPQARGVILPEHRRVAWLTFFVNDAPCGPEDWRKALARIERGIERHGGGAIVLHEARFTVPGGHPGPDKSWLPQAVDELITWGKANGYTFAQYTDEPAP